ncbi:unnamed protein product [Rangifer tarandus platyrhynchus]|uniref:Uncharacterized protein n=2 Tax=Rangifer tarandus platyrhynchus TaxID=3082113 RepID=A0ABN8YXA8_RANTA|nr:unnamed protein product [Rangifer tarandus platyrhynchus]
MSSFTVLQMSSCIFSLKLLQVSLATGACPPAEADLRVLCAAGPVGAAAPGAADGTRCTAHTSLSRTPWVSGQLSTWCGECSPAGLAMEENAAQEGTLASGLCPVDLHQP